MPAELAVTKAAFAWIKAPLAYTPAELAAIKAAFAWMKAELA